MTTRTSRPKWWQVYLTFPFLIALFMLDTRLKLSERGHQAVQIGIILLVYGLVHLWLKANAAALSHMDHKQIRGTVIVTRIPQHPLPDTKSDQRLMFQLPGSEIKGILSDTYEMDIIDAEFIAVDDAPQEFDKEQK